MKLKLRCAALMLALVLAFSGCGLFGRGVPDTVLGDSLFDDGLLAVKVDGKWGFVDKNGDMRIQPTFLQVRPFSGSVAAVYDGTAWGFVGTNGKYAIASKYTEVKDFAQGRAAVRVGNLWGYIDAKGKTCVEPKYESAGDYSSEGLAVVKKDGKYGVINLKGKTVAKFEYDEIRTFAYGYAAVNKGGVWNFINAKGKLLLANSTYQKVGNFSYNGLAPVQAGGLWGYVNQKGELVVDPQFTQVQGFSVNGLAAVTLGDGWGYINKDGRLVIPPQFESAMPFAEDVAVVEVDGKFGLIDREGKFVARAVYEKLSAYMNSDRIRAQRNGEAGYLNGSGVDVIPFGFAEECANYFYDDGFTVVKVGGKYGVINYAGQYIVNPRFDEILFTNYEF